MHLSLKLEVFGGFFFRNWQYLSSPTSDQVKITPIFSFKSHSSNGDNFDLVRRGDFSIVNSLIKLLWKTSIFKENALNGGFDTHFATEDGWFVILKGHKISILLLNFSYCTKYIYLKSNMRNESMLSYWSIVCKNIFELLKCMGYLCDRVFFIS